MGVHLRQSMNLSQSLKMTPQLQQAIRLLQLSRMELETEIRKEMEENPALEEVQDIKEDSDQLRTRDGTAESDVVDSSEQDPRQQDEFEWENYVEQMSRPLPSTGVVQEEILNYENILTSRETLHEHLKWQLKLSGFSEDEEFLVNVLVSYLNDDGYLSMPLSEIAQEEGVAEKELEEMLPFVQEFDPPGIGARDLKECLLIQVRRLEEDTKDVVQFIENHLKDLEKRQYDIIAKTMGLEIPEVVEIGKFISSMDPRPGRVFATSDTQYVLPDVFVHKVGDEYIVSLNEDGLPRLKVSGFYRNLLMEKEKDTETQNYVRDRLRSAAWLVNSIEQRQKTILKVAQSIVKGQKDFFDKGPGHIRPMILRDVANDIGMHESTVSRVTNGKFLHSPQGTFELKYFFNSGIRTSDGDSLASESVKQKIRDFVGKESPEKPLSDQELVNLLRQEGIQIARRTVAKYRDILKILPSGRRKKYF